MTSASKLPLAALAAVRQAPLTLTESPSVSSAASWARTLRRTPPPVRSSDSTLPISLTIPVNISLPWSDSGPAPLPLSQSRADQQVAVGALPIHLERRSRFGDLPCARAFGKRPGARAPDHDRSDEQAQLVDLARVQEGAGERGAALEEHARDVAASQLGQPGQHPVPRFSVADHDPDAGRLQGAHTILGRGGRGDYEQRRLADRTGEVRLQRQPRMGVEHDARGLAKRYRLTRGEQRIVGQRRPDPDAYGVGLGSPPVDEPSAGFAGDPLGIARGGRHPAVEADRGLDGHERPPCPGVLPECLIEKPRLRSFFPLDQLDLDPLVPKDAWAPTVGLLARIIRGDDHARDPGLQG